MKLRMLITRGVGVSGMLAAYAAFPSLLAAIAVGVTMLALLVFFGVVLPAVWSSKPTRRKAAATVLGQILGTLRRRRE
jgi:hypothetical protein